MTIKEVERKTGIIKQNIRFYEKEGLLTPSRNKDNGYREYNEADIQRLTEIKLYRKLDISLEDIKKIYEESLEIDVCMERYANYLEEKIKKAKRTKEMCEAIKEEYNRNSKVNFEENLLKIENYEKQGMEFKNIIYDFITKAKGCIKEILPNATIVFEPENPITNKKEFTNELIVYCDKMKSELVILKESMSPTVAINGMVYIAQLELPQWIRTKLRIFTVCEYGFKCVALYEVDNIWGTEKFLKKGFGIDLKDALKYPTSEEICSMVESYNHGLEKLEFVNRDNPVAFYLGKTLYQVEVSLARGGYYLHCKEL